MPGQDDGLGKKAEAKIKLWLDDPSSGYSFEVNSNEKTKRIKCLETNQTFESLESYKVHFNISNSQLSKARYSKSGTKSAFKINDLTFSVLE